MKNITVFPYPYKMTPNSEINDGLILNTPIFCKRNSNSKTCRDHYLRIIDSLGFHECPHGFGSEVIIIEDFRIINTCLNIESYSNKKATQRRISSNDFSPRLTEKYYKDSLDKISKLIENNKEYYQKIVSDKLLFSSIEEQREILNNTFHELRKLNQQLKSQTEKLIYKSNNATLQDILKLQYLAQNVFSTSQLISIRLNTYDFGINPDLILSENKSSIQIHNKFHKVSQCLREYANQNHLRIELHGESYAYIHANDVIELLPFLLLDNAIKYSHPNEKIHIQFDEYDDLLEVQIKGLSIKHKDNEIKQLFERGVRGDKVKGVQGQGIGLFLAKYICDIHNIKINIKLGNNSIYKDAKVYSDFTVKLLFNDIISETLSDR